MKKVLKISIVSTLAVFYLLQADQGLVRYTFAHTDSNRQDFGRGFDIRSTSWRGHCVTGDILYAGRNTSSIQWELQNKIVHTEAAHEGMLKLAVNLWVIGAAQRTRLYAHSFEGERSITWVYRRQHTGKDRYLSNIRLTKFGKEVLSTEDPAYIHRMCGDGYTGYAKQGGDLSISIRMVFRSREVKAVFKTRANLNILFFSKTRTLSKTLQDEFHDTKIWIDAHQNGGDPKRLTRILASFNQNRSCSFINHTRCQKFLATLHDYGTSSSGFSKDIKDRQSIQTWGVMHYADVRLQEFVNIYTTGELSPWTKKLLSDLRQLHRRFQAVADHLLSLRKDPVRGDWNMDLAQHYEKTDAYLTKLEAALLTCQITPALCQKSLEKRFQEAVPYYLLKEGGYERPVFDPLFFKKEVPIK